MAQSLNYLAPPLPQIDALSFSPPLVITEAECDEVVARFGRALDQLADELVREGS